MWFKSHKKFTYSPLPLLFHFFAPFSNALRSLAGIWSSASCWPLSHLITCEGGQNIVLLVKVWILEFEMYIYIYKIERERVYFEKHFKTQSFYNTDCSTCSPLLSISCPPYSTTLILAFGRRMMLMAVMMIARNAELPEIGGMGAVEPIDFKDVEAELDLDDVEIPGMQSKDSLSKKCSPFGCHCLKILEDRYELQCL